MTDLYKITTDLERLREDVDYLTALLEPQLLGGGPQASRGAVTAGATPAAGPHVWHTLTRSEAADAWDTLLAWVDWLTDRYQLEDTMTECWYRHGAIVDELDALRAAWIGAYLDPAARPTDAVYWHELLARTLTRLRDWDRYGCAAGTHRDDPPHRRAPSVTASRTAHVQDDIASRGPGRHGTAPAPAAESAEQTSGAPSGDGAGDPFAF